MTFAKLTKAMEATGVFWLKVAPLVREMVHHYQDIISAGKLTERDIDDGRERVREFRKALGGGPK